MAAKRTPAGKQGVDGGERVLVLKGPEAFLRRYYLESLADALRDRPGPPLETIRFDGEQASAADVLDECRSRGLMPCHKLVVVDSADKFVNERTRPALEKYAADPAPEATLVLRAETWRPGRLDKAVAAVGRVVSCDSPTPPRAAQWVTGRAQAGHGVRIDPAAARRLVDAIGTDLGRLDSELGKLALGVGEGGAISAAAVEELVAPTREADKPWPLQDELLSGDPARALAYVHLWMHNAPRDQAIAALWACVDLTRTISQAARLAARGVPAAQIARQRKLWPAERGAAIAGLGRRLGPTRAADLHERACRADAAVKRGAPGRRRLEALCVEIASAIARGADTPSTRA